MLVKIAIGWLISGIATMSATARSCNSIQMPKLTDVIDQVMRGREIFEAILLFLIGKKTDCFSAELAEAKTCVRRILSDLKLIQHEAEVVISIATLKGEDGARTPSQVAEARRQLFASFRTEEQTECNRYKRVVARRYKGLQDLLDKLDKEGSSMTRAENALRALEEKTTPISEWKKCLHGIGIVVTAAAAAGCIIVIGAGVGLGVGFGLACGAGAFAFVSILTAYRYDRVTDASAEKCHKDAGELRKVLAGAKYNLVEVGDIRLHFSDFEEFGSTADRGTDEIERIFESRLGPLEEGAAECQNALLSLKEKTGILRKYARVDA